MRWHNGQIRRSQNPDSEEVFQDCLAKWEESVAHSILARSSFTPSKGRIHLRRPILSRSFFACNSAADHTFRMRRNTGAIHILEELFDRPDGRGERVTSLPS